MAGHRSTTFAAGSHVPGANLNSIQDRAHTLDLATGTDAGAPTDTLGADWVTYQSPDAGIGAGTVTTLDASDRDWRERLVQASARFVTTAARRWGRADEHVGNDPATANVRTALGVTGPGAVGAASASVVDGTPPVVTTGSCPIPLDVRVDGTVWLFADPVSGALLLYNATTTPLHLDLLVMATGRSTDPSAPPPDLVPTLTEILWLTPSVAASRPVSPGALIAIHRATDTGAVTLWDGGAWRSLGLVSPLTTRGDLWRRDGSGDARLALGAAGSLLTSDGTDPVWRSVEDALPGAEVSTSDDTWTTIATIAVDDLSVALLDLSIVALRDDASAAGAWRGSCAWRRYGGAMHEVAALSLLLSDTEAVGLEVRAQASGTTGVAVQVKGIAATDYSWRVSYLRTSI